MEECCVREVWEETGYRVQITAKLFEKRGESYGWRVDGPGVGTKLLTEVESEARKAGCHRVWLITSNDNIDALRFYQRRGYRITVGLLCIQR